MYIIIVSQACVPMYVCNHVPGACDLIHHQSIELAKHPINPG